MEKEKTRKVRLSFEVKMTYSNEVEITEEEFEQLEKVSGGDIYDHKPEAMILERYVDMPHDGTPLNVFEDFNMEEIE